MTQRKRLEGTLASWHPHPKEPQSLVPVVRDAGPADEIADRFFDSAPQLHAPEPPFALEANETHERRVVIESTAVRARRRYLMRYVAGAVSVASLIGLAAIVRLTTARDASAGADGFAHYAVVQGRLERCVRPRGGSRGACRARPRRRASPTMATACRGAAGCRSEAVLRGAPQPSLDRGAAEGASRCGRSCRRGRRPPWKPSPRCPRAAARPPKRWPRRRRHLPPASPRKSRPPSRARRPPQPSRRARRAWRALQGTAGPRSCSRRARSRRGQERIAARSRARALHQIDRGRRTLRLSRPHRRRRVAGSGRPALPGEGGASPRHAAASRRAPTAPSGEREASAGLFFGRRIFLCDSKIRVRSG